MLVHECRLWETFVIFTFSVSQFILAMHVLSFNVVIQGIHSGTMLGNAKMNAVKHSCRKLSKIDCEC